MNTNDTTNSLSNSSSNWPWGEQPPTWTAASLAAEGMPSFSGWASFSSPIFPPQYRFPVSKSAHYSELMGKEIQHFVFHPYNFIYEAQKQIGLNQGFEAAEKFYQEAVKRYPLYSSFSPEIKDEELRGLIYRVQCAVCRCLAESLRTKASQDPSIVLNFADIFEEINYLEDRLTAPFDLDKMYNRERQNSNPLVTLPSVASSIRSPAVAETIYPQKSSLMEVESDPSPQISAPLLTFLPEDDIHYLQNEQAFLDRCRSALKIHLDHSKIEEEVFAKLQVVAEELTNEKREFSVGYKLADGGAINAYLPHFNSDTTLYNLSFDQKKIIEAVFMALALRQYLIAENKKEELCDVQHREFCERKEKNYSDWWSEDFQPKENTLLFRFERAIQKSKLFVKGDRNKGLLLSLGALLEEGGDYTYKYISGGYASKGTRLRLFMIESLCSGKSRKSVKCDLEYETRRPDMRKEAPISWSTKNSFPTDHETYAFTSAKEALDSSVFSDEASRQTYMKLRMQSFKLYLQAIQKECEQLKSVVINNPSQMSQYHSLKRKEDRLNKNLDQFNAYLLPQMIQKLDLNPDAKEG